MSAHLEAFGHIPTNKMISKVTGVTYATVAYNMAKKKEEKRAELEKAQEIIMSHEVETLDKKTTGSSDVDKIRYFTNNQAVKAAQDITAAYVFRNMMQVNNENNEGFLFSKSIADTIFNGVKKADMVDDFEDFAVTIIEILQRHFDKHYEQEKNTNSK